MMNPMAQQQMQQQMLLQQQMMQAQIMEPMKMHLNNDKKKFNIIFKDTIGRIFNFCVDENMTIKELIDRYMNRVFGYENKDLFFIFNPISLPAAGFLHLNIEM